MKTVVLVGLMGSGKTAVGRRLALLLDLPWQDLDQALERQWGPIARQFASRGEAEFRRRESLLLARMLKKRSQVLSTGGGVVLSAHNRRLLSKHVTIYLQVSTKALLKRLGPAQRSKRPLLKGGDPKAILARMQRERGALYRECASLSVRAGDNDPQELAKRIQKRLLAGV